jgi:hypothetical protein
MFSFIERFQPTKSLNDALRFSVRACGSIEKEEPGRSSHSIVDKCRIIV